MSRSIGRLHGIVFLFAAVALLSMAVPSNAKNQGADCSNLVVNRSYSQQFQGFLNVPLYFSALGAPAPPGIGTVPNAGVGFVTFLPGGRVTAQVTLAIGMMVLARDIVFDNTSHYSLSWDTSKVPAVCSGEVTLNAAGEPPFHFQLFVDPGGRHVDMIHTDPGLIVGIRGFPVETSACGNHPLNGKYSYNMSGWLLAAALASGPGPVAPPFCDAKVGCFNSFSGYSPFAFAGEMAFSPPGIPRSATGNDFVWLDTGSIGGNIVSRVGTGSYEIAPDCSGTMTLKDEGGHEFHLEIVVGKGGKALYLLNTDTVTLDPGPPPLMVPLYILSATADRVE